MSLWRLLLKPFRLCSSLGQITVIFQKGEREIEARIQGGIRLKFVGLWQPRTKLQQGTKMRVS